MQGRYCVIPSECTSDVFSLNSYAVLDVSMNLMYVVIDAFVGTDLAQRQGTKLLEGELSLGGLSRKVMVLPDNNTLSR